MKTINLKKYYYPLFVTDTFIEVSDEIAEALLLMRREENNRTHKIWYHKAYYSLDCEDGIENCAFDFTAKSPEEILLEQEEEQLFLATLEHLSEAMDNLTDIQARRGKIVTAERRIKVLDERLSMWEKYERNKGTRRQFDKMKPGKKKEQFEQKHSAELALYEAAVRYLEKLKTTGEEITPKKWQAEADRLKAEKSVQYQKMKSMREDIKAVENLKKTAEQLARTENEPARKKEEQEV